MTTLADLPLTTLAALAGTRLRPDGRRFAVIGLPSAQRGQALAAAGDAFVFAADDGAEFTLVLPETALPTVRTEAGRVATGFELLHLDAILPWDTVGYGAAVLKALAEAGIAVGFYSGYAHDSLLIPAAQMSQALAVLTALIAEAQQRL
ncbi:MAG: ACT domain-containing protein [Caldilineales bacterium]|nr:ACT domain-containing protein [Caldilineales bacterium]